MLAYGLPLVPAAFALWALALVDRIMLSKLGSLADVGQYAVANRVSNVLLLAVTGLRRSPSAPTSSRSTPAIRSWRNRFGARR